MDTGYTTVDLAVDMRNLQRTLLHFSEIDSTNRFLLDENDCPGGTVVLADYQSAGRGRFERMWQSPPGDALLFSIVLKEKFCDFSLSVYPLLSAVAVFNGLNSVLPESTRLTVKWPNDLLLNGKKVCGILAQSRMKGSKCEKLVVGIGLNVNQPPEFFRKDLKKATSVFQETGKLWNRFEILKRVLEEMDLLLNILQDSGECSIIQMWQRACDSMGRKIAIDDGRKIVEGIFTGIAEDGALQLNTDSETHIFYAGDVTVVKE